MVGNPIRCHEAPTVFRAPPRLHEHTDDVVGPSVPARDQAS